MTSTAIQFEKHEYAATWPWGDVAGEFILWSYRDVWRVSIKGTANGDLRSTLFPTEEAALEAVKERWCTGPDGEETGLVYSRRPHPAGDPMDNPLTHRARNKALHGPADAETEGS